MFLSRSLYLQRLTPATPLQSPVIGPRLTRIHEDVNDSNYGVSGDVQSLNRNVDYDETRKCPNNIKSSYTEPLARKFKRPLPRLPFCEEYDGVNLRRTSTISQTIKELIEHQKKNAQEDDFGKNDVVNYKSTRYFDRLQDIQDVFEVSDETNTDTDLTETDSGYNVSFDTASLVSDFDPFEDIRFEVDDSDGICTVDLELEYVKQSNRLFVNVIQAEDVTDAKSSNKLIDSFVKISMFHGKKNTKQQTNVITKSRDPVFNHVFLMENVIEKWIHIMCLRVQLYQKKRFRKNCIGETLIWLDDLDLVSNPEVKLTETLKKPYL